MSKFKTPKNEKKVVKLHKIERSIYQCMNNHYGKFEYIGMNTFRFTYYTMGGNNDLVQHHSKNEKKNSEMWTK